MRAKSSISLWLAAVALLAFGLPLQAAQTDDSIEAAVKESYVFKTFLKDDAIEVESEDGTVTLTGTVAEESHKSLAGETVSNLPEVKSVDNQLEVKGEHLAEASDAWITTKVKTTLLFHRNVSAMTKVDTKDGIVTLQGEADSQEKKDLTTEYARDIEGVIDVKNEMTVARDAEATRTVGDKIDDASITAQVKMSLLYHRSTSGLQTKVETEDGVVTLSGKADTEAEKDLATQYAKDVSGVKEWGRSSIADTKILKQQLAL